MPPAHDRLAFLARAVRVTLVVYLSPVILAVLIVGLAGMAIARLGEMMAALPSLPPRLAAPRVPALIGAPDAGHRD